MDTLEFVSAVFDSLSWPLTVIILVLLFRKPLSDLLANLRSVKYGDAKFDFSGALQKLDGEAETAGLRVPDQPQDTGIAPRTTEDSIQSAARLTTDFPGPAIGVAWLAVEHELVRAVERVAIPNHEPRKSALTNIRALQTHGYLDDDTLAVLHGMRRLRNAVMHATHAPARISAEDARQFVRFAKAVTDKLEGIGK